MRSDAPREGADDGADRLHEPTLADCDFNLAALHSAYPIKRQTSAERTQASPERRHPEENLALDRGWRGSGAGETLVACPLAGLSALGAYYAGVRARAVRADAVPQRGLPRVMPGTMRFSQTRQGAFLPTPPRRPTASAAPGVKRPDRARATAAERRNGRGPSNGNNDIELPSTSILHLLLLFARGIFLTEGFQATIRLPEVPPRPLRGAWARFSLG